MTSLLPVSRRPDITVNAAGRIDITARVARILQLNPGDVIDVCQNGPEYFLYVRFRAPEVVGRHEGQCRPSSRSGNGSYRTWSVRLAAAIRQAAGSQQLILRLPCGTPQVIDNKVYIPIIIHCLL